jgi:hypothetical protein
MCSNRNGAILQWQDRDLVPQVAVDSNYLRSPATRRGARPDGFPNGCT